MRTLLKAGTAGNSSIQAWSLGTLEGRMNTKLTEDEIIAIREAAAGGIGDVVIARHYGTSRRNVHYIRTGKRWPDAGGPLTENKKVVTRGTGHERGRAV